MNITAIKQTVNSRGWRDILVIFKEEVEQEKRDIKTDGRRFEDVAVDTIAQKQAAKIVKRVINKVNRLGEDEKADKIIYR